MRVTSSEFKHFIDEEITVVHANEPLHSKSPQCPDAFTWRGSDYQIVELLEQWHSYERRGKFAKNMTVAHLQSASSRGSLNVGRFFFTVRCASGQIFTVYYDRKGKSVDNRSGRWVLLGENDDSCAFLGNKSKTTR